MKDPCLEKFKSEWDQATILAEKAVILYNWVHYIKLRYRGVGKLAAQIGPHLAYLEDHVAESTGKDFLKIQRVIADGRRTISDCGSKYGSGFKRRPNARERASIAKAFPCIRLVPDTDISAPDNLDDVDSNDIFDRDMEHGAA